MNKRLTKISKYLAFVLRHHPESIGIDLAPEGWTNLEELVAKANTHGKTSLTVPRVYELIEVQQPPLFELSDDRQLIRALP
ncbi:RNA 2'-phosphotransferase [Roseimaritima sediminicola]|uniref:RNA 2'-phosphotransferase n=1 Tax=Roseimaritima sediminicola TaxID=2662066 RepID=UPI0012983C64|nr:RNA 2'-phosphotransferase [Roseimaritima sediminicola]